MLKITLVIALVVLSACEASHHNAEEDRRNHNDYLEQLYTQDEYVDDDCFMDDDDLVCEMQ